MTLARLFARHVLSALVGIPGAVLCGLGALLVWLSSALVAWGER